METRTDQVFLETSLDYSTIYELAEQIVSIVENENKMIHPTAESITQSYLDGRGAILKNSENRAIAFCRLIPLLPYEKMNNQLLMQGCAEVYELGTVIVDPKERGKGYGKDVIHALFEKNRKAIVNNEMLIIGTTTTIPMLKILNSMDSAIYFHAGSLDRYRWLKTLTCTCSPNEPLGGTGIHLDPFCTVRAPIREILPVNSELNLIKLNQEAGCKIFISNLELADHVNQLLEIIIGSQMSEQEFAREV